MKFSLVLCSLGITDGPKTAGQLIAMSVDFIVNIDWGSIASWFWNGLTWLFTAQWLW